MRGLFKISSILCVLIVTFLFSLPLIAAGMGEAPQLTYSLGGQRLPGLKDFEVKTQAAADIQATSASLNGQLNYNGKSMDVQVSFQWGTVSGNYTGETTSQTMKKAGHFSVRVTGLIADTTYYYRAEAEGDRILYGSELSFRTAQELYTLTINVIGEGIVSPDAGDHIYTKDAEVSLSAIPAPGWGFGGWQMDLVGIDNPATIVMDGNKIITANFVRESSPSPSPVEPPSPSPVEPISLPAGGGFFGGSLDGGGGAGSGDRIYFDKYMTGAPGVFALEADVKSIDGLLRITFPEGTKGQTAEGWALSYIMLTPVHEDQQELPFPEDSKVIGLIYSLQPEGSAFSPPATITMLYKDSWIQPGFSDKELVIGYWDVAGKQWMPLAGCVVDYENNTITAPLSHFSSYAILSYPPQPDPASFTVSGLAISPSEASPGQEVTISATVTNIGGVAGKYIINLKVDGNSAESREVYLEPANSGDIQFSMAADQIGNYTMDVNGNTLQLIVTGPSPEVTATPAEPQAISSSIPEETDLKPVRSMVVTPASQSENKSTIPFFAWMIAVVAVLVGIAAVIAVSRHVDRNG